MLRVLKTVTATGAVLAALCANAYAQEGKFTLYTSQPNTDAQQTIDAFKKKFPKVEATFFREGTTKVLAKLEAEIAAGAPQADVLLIADSVTMEDLKKRGLLSEHAARGLEAYPAGIHDPQKMWFATKLITTGIVYNTTATMKPTSWADLLKPEAKGQLAMPSPLTSGAALIHAATLVGNMEGGWDYYRKLKENGAQASGGNGQVLTRVAGGEKLYGMIVDFMPIREKAKGAPVEFVFPKEGVSVISEPVAVLKSAKNPAAAKAFVDFLLSKEGQEVAAAQGYVPAHPAVALPKGYPERSAIKVMSFDAAKALAETDANKKTFTDIFGQ